MRGESIVKSAVVVLLWGLAVNVSTAKYSGGTGEPNDPYRIATANDLNDIGNHVEDYNKHFVMVNDINLADYTGAEFNIIGSYPDNPFTGVFEGNEHIVSNLAYESNDIDYIGLFACVDDANAEIRNLTLIEPNIVAGTGALVGALVGVLDKGTISGCGVVGGSVVGSVKVGGLGGGNSGQVINCYSACTVSGVQDCGGLAGGNFFGDVSNCYAFGTVCGDIGVGGLVGYNIGHIIYSYSRGRVCGEDFTGGLVGKDPDSDDLYTSCFWDSDVNPDVNGIGNTTDPNVVGKTTTEMMTESTFTDAGWDFVEVWDIGEGQTYPFLRVYPAGDLNHDGIVNFYDYAIFALQWLGGEWPVGIE
ncbi:MAG: GLUG motif-containing protein [Planctomycetota bacterium]|jgi:hypothetical protein